MSWRDRARPIIARALAECDGQTVEEKRQALREAYPFGPKAHYPYKAWLSEIAVQMGRRPPPARGRSLPCQPVEGQGTISFYDVQEQYEDAVALELEE